MFSWIWKWIVPPKNKTVQEKKVPEVKIEVDPLVSLEEDEEHPISKFEKDSKCQFDMSYY